MIDRVGNISLPGRLDRADRGAEPRDGGRDFENLLRGVEQATEGAASSRAGQSGLRSRSVAPLDSAPVSAPRTAIVPRSVAPARIELQATPEEAAAPATQTPAAQAPAAARAVAPGFVRSADTNAPHLPRFKEVPESAKHPLGPYRQAPGGDWWLVSPFTGPAPWLALDASSNPKKALESEPLPIGFEQVFGPRPGGSTAAAQWEQDLSYFKGTGLPEGFDEVHLEAAKAEFEAWGLGEPVFYEGRYGWQVRFPESQLPTFETTATTALLTPHIVIAEHQVRSIQEGVALVRYHPWLPERLQA